MLCEPTFQQSLAAASNGKTQVSFGRLHTMMTGTQDYGPSEEPRIGEICTGSEEEPRDDMKIGEQCIDSNPEPDQPESA